MSDVVEMVNVFLKSNGYDGLYNENGECACLVDDLNPGCCLSYECEAGYKAPCPGCCGDHDFHIVERIDNEVRDE